jgi:hypothetical protein
MDGMIIPVALQRPLAGQDWLLGSWQDTSSPNSLIACGAAAGTDRRFREIKSFEEDNFLRFAGFSVYKCPVFDARGNAYKVSEVKDRRDRINELYEQVAALG